MKLDKSLNNKEKIIVIGDKDFFPILKANKSFADIKFLSIDKAISTLTFEINEKMILALMKGNEKIPGQEYIKAKKIIRSIQLLGDNRINSAPSLIREAWLIIKDFIKVPPFDPSYIFKGKSLYLFNQENLDTELKTLFSEHGYELKDINFKDFNISENNKEFKVINFDNKFEQYMYVFANIRTLLKDEEMVDHIRLIIKDEYDLFYVSFFSRLFNIDFYDDLKTSLFVQPNVIKAFKEFYRKKIISLDLFSVTDEATEKLKEIIELYELNKQSFSFEKAYLNLIEILSQNKVKDDTQENKGIYVSKNFLFSDTHKDDLTFILDFQDDIFYENFKDNDVIIDAEKELLHLNQSYTKTLIDKQKKIDFLKYNKIIHLSRVKQHLNEHIYNSRLIKEMGDKAFSQIPFSIFDDKCINELKQFLFTPLAAKTLASVLKDKNINISNITFDKYDNKVQNISIPIDDKKEFSISEIEQYSKCPFKFLLDKKYNLSSLDDKYYMHLGSLFHKVLEHIDDYQFKKKFDKYYDDGIKEFKEKMIDDKVSSLGNKYLIFLDKLIRDWFKTIAFIYFDRLQEVGDKNIKIYKEFKFHDFIDNDNYKFTGKIDCLMTHFCADDKYLTILDYKSGSKSFQPLSVCTGLNVQLPIYFLAIDRICNRQSTYKYDKSDDKDERYAKESIESFKSYKPSGFGLKRIFGNSIKKLCNDDNILSSTSICGRTCANILGKTDTKYKSSLTIKHKNDKGKYVQNKEQLIKVSNSSKDGTLKATFNKKNDTVYTIDELVSQAKEIIKERIDEIKKSLYPIWITACEDKVKNNCSSLSKKETNCAYCSLTDICYKTNSDMHDFSQKVYEIWHKKVSK